MDTDAEDMHGYRCRGHAWIQMQRACMDTDAEDMNGNRCRRHEWIQMQRACMDTDAEDMLYVHKISQGAI